MLLFVGGAALAVWAFQTWKAEDFIWGDVLTPDRRDGGALLTYLLIGVCIAFGGISMVILGPGRGEPDAGRDRKASDE